MDAGLPLSACTMSATLTAVPASAGFSAPLDLGPAPGTTFEPNPAPGEWQPTLAPAYSPEVPSGLTDTWMYSPALAEASARADAVMAASLSAAPAVPPPSGPGMRFAPVAGGEPPRHDPRIWFKGQATNRDLYAVADAIVRNSGDPTTFLQAFPQAYDVYARLSAVNGLADSALDPGVQGKATLMMDAPANPMAVSKLYQGLGPALLATANGELDERSADAATLRGFTYGAGFDLKSPAEQSRAYTEYRKAEFMVRNPDHPFTIQQNDVDRQAFLAASSGQATVWKGVKYGSASETPLSTYQRVSDSDIGFAEVEAGEDFGGSGLRNHYSQQLAAARRKAEVEQEERWAAQQRGREEFWAVQRQRVGNTGGKRKGL